MLGADVPDTRWLMQHSQGWYAVQDVPRPLCEALGKKRLVLSLNTRESKTAAGVRRVPIHPDLAAPVARRVAGKQAGAYLFHEAAAPDRHGRSSALSKRFGRYRQALGVHEREDGRRHSRVDFHSWRRWFVTKARSAGIDRWVVAAVVGHGVGNLD